MRSLAPAQAWLDGRTTRERLMLALCGGLILGVLVWLLVYRPVHHWRETAADDRTRALADEAAVRAAVVRLAAPTPTFEGDLQLAVQRSAEAAGLTPVLGMAANGDLGFTLADVNVGAALAWIGGLESEGIRSTALSIVENADTTVTVEGALAASSSHARNSGGR